MNETIITFVFWENNGLIQNYTKNFTIFLV
jgi:hypothetical protein